MLNLYQRQVIHVGVNSIKTPTKIQYCSKSIYTVLARVLGRILLVFYTAIFKHEDGSSVKTVFHSKGGLFFCLVISRVELIRKDK
jgi:hypothetical protein